MNPAPNAANPVGPSQVSSKNRHLKQKALLAVRQARWPALVALVLGAAVAVNVLASRYPVRWDLTVQKRFSLSDQTLKVLRSLDRPVKLVAVIHRNTESGTLLEDLVREYGRKSGRVSFEIVDFARSKNVASSYGVEVPDTVVVESGGKRRRVEGYNLFAMTVDGYEFKGEQALTRAILEVTGRSGRKVYFLEGHGEPALGEELSGFRPVIEGEGHTADSLNLAISGKLPDDAAVIVIMGPQQDLDEREADALIGYVKKGGRLFILADPAPGKDMPQLSRVVAEVGVRLGNDLVVDPARGFFMDPTSPVPEQEHHPITDPIISNRLNVVLPGARSVAEAKGGGKGLTVVTLLKSSTDAWGELNPAATPLRRDTGEAAGPLPLAVASSASGGKPVAVVVGSSRFVRGRALTVRGNVDFFLNSLGWLLGQDELVSVRAKTFSQPRVELTLPQAQGIFYGTVVFMPLAVLIGGGYVWLKRRRL